MYESFYGLKERPFNLTPDPRYLYLSEKHREAFAHLLYGIRDRSGFVMVSGEVGTGKTTICRTLLNQLEEDTEVAYILNPFLEPEELLRTINEDFGIDTRGESTKELIDELNEYLLEQNSMGKNCVLVIDEAQDLTPQVLEQVRLLSNLETETQKLLQIVLIGQPELVQLLQLPALRQLNQRITARYHLKPLNFNETQQYIAYRLRVAGGRNKVHFTRRAVKAIYRNSGGTPRVINALCDRALLIGFTSGTREIKPAIVKRARHEIRGERVAVPDTPKPRRFVGSLLRASVAALAIVGAVSLGAVMYQQTGGSTPALEWPQWLKWPVVTPNATAARDPQGAVPPAQAPAPSPESSADPTANEPAAAPAEPEPAHVAAEPAAERPAQPEEEAGDVSAEAPAEADPELASEVQPDPEPLTLDQALEAAAPAAARAAAIERLLAYWGRTPVAASGTAAGPDAFVQAAAAVKLDGYVFTETPLETVLAIDLPAAIEVQSPKGRYWLALVGASDQSLTLWVEKEPAVTVAKDSLAERYTGTAVVIWNDPMPGAPTLREGMSGETVERIQQYLRALGLLDAVTGTYDAATVHAVEQLQWRAKLKVDGLAGRQTRLLATSWLPEFQTPSLLKGQPLPQLTEAAARPAPAPNPAPKPEPAPAPTPPPPVKVSQEPADKQAAEAPEPAAPAPETAPEEAPAPDEPEPGAEAEPQTPDNVRVLVESLDTPPTPGRLTQPVPTPDRAVTPPSNAGMPFVPADPSGEDRPEETSS